MTIRFTYPRLTAGLAAGVLTGLFLSGAAYAITGSAFNYSTPKNGWYSINTAAMVPEIEGLNYQNRVLSSSLQASGSGCFQTAVNLPNRAKITGFLVWYQEISPARMVFWLFRNRLSNGAGHSIVAEDAADATGRRVMARYPVPNVTIDNNAFSYGVAVCFNEQSTFYGARINYTYRTAGD